MPSTYTLTGLAITQCACQSTAVCTLAYVTSLFVPRELSAPGVSLGVVGCFAAIGAAISVCSFGNRCLANSNKPYLLGCFLLGHMPTPRADKACVPEAALWHGAGAFVPVPANFREAL